jgi:RimJ/RimL family protein N-acetyltransferase
MLNAHITGDRIVLRPLEKADLENRVRWYNDPRVRETLVMDETFELRKTIAWFERVADDDRRAEFVIQSPDGRPVGVTGLIDIDRQHGVAECYCVIGEKDFWGKGLGTEIHSILIQWAFEKLGLYKIRADIRANNPAIFRVVEKLGFKIEGTLRKEKIVDGQRIDLCRIGLLREEFTPTHKTFVVEQRTG